MPLFMNLFTSLESIRRIHVKLSAIGKRALQRGQFSFPAQWTWNKDFDGMRWVEMNAMPTVSNVSLAADGFLFFIIFFAGVIVSWWALGALKWEQFTRAPLSTQARMLRFILAMVGGVVWGLIAILYFLAVQALRML